jgi:hypothetical protein
MSVHEFAGRSRFEAMNRLVLMGLALLLILAGLVILPLPLPFGAFLLIVGCALLVSVNEAASLRFKRLRSDYPRLNRLVAPIERRLPGALGRAMRRTAPDSV